LSRQQWKSRLSGWANLKKWLTPLVLFSKMIVLVVGSLSWTADCVYNNQLSQFSPTDRSVAETTDMTVVAKGMAGSYRESFFA
jgi:hypothetical protein